MKMKIFLTIFILVFSVNYSEAKSKKPNQMAESFFQMVMNGEINEAYDKLFEGSTIPTSKPQAVNMLKTQTASGLPLYGSIIGYEKIREEKFGGSVVRLVYILKSEKAPTVWELYFYKPNQNWFLASIIFNDQFQLLAPKQG